MKKCANCGKDFTPRKASLPGTYCSPPCSRAAKKRQFTGYIQAHRDRKAK